MSGYTLLSNNPLPCLNRRSKTHHRLQSYEHFCLAAIFTLAWTFFSRSIYQTQCVVFGSNMRSHTCALVRVSHKLATYKQWGYL